MSQNKQIIEDYELQEWLEALDNVITKADQIEHQKYYELASKLTASGTIPTFNLTTPFRNTISIKDEARNAWRSIFRKKIRSYIRWNALAMVLKANKSEDDLGGHISTFSSAATLYDVGFNYFFKGHDSGEADLIYFQGHCSPGIYARSFLEGRLTEKDLDNFRREVDKPGISSYPHPWLMPDFWAVSYSINGFVLTMGTIKHM